MGKEPHEKAKRSKRKLICVSAAKTQPHWIELTALLASLPAMPNFPPPPPPSHPHPPGHLRAVQRPPNTTAAASGYVPPNKYNSTNGGQELTVNPTPRYATTDSSQQQVPAVTRTAGWAPPPPPPPRSLGSQAEPLSGLTPPSSTWNGEPPQSTQNHAVVVPSNNMTTATTLHQPMPPPPHPSTNAGSASTVAPSHAYSSVPTASGSVLQPPRFPPPPPRLAPSPSTPMASTLPPANRIFGQQSAAVNRDDDAASPPPPSVLLDPMSRSPAPSDLTSTSSHYNNFGASQTFHTSYHADNHNHITSSPLSQSQRSQPAAPLFGSQLPPVHNAFHPPPPPHNSQVHPPPAHSIQGTVPSGRPPPPPPFAGHDGGVHSMPPYQSSSHTPTHPPFSQQQQHQQQLKEQQQLQHQLQQQYAGSLQQQHPQPPSNPSGPRLHPGQLPRPPLPTHPQESTAPPLVYYTRQSMLGVVPPPADTRFAVADDTGNASPNVLRSSLYTIPQTRREWHETGDVPWGVLCTPLAIPTDGEYEPPPLVLPDGTHREGSDPERVPLMRLDSLGDDNGSSSLVPPPRCTSCQAYANPFVADDGTCNFCGHRQSRAPLQSPGPFGTMEFPVDGPYVTREHPVRPMYLYALDLTCPHIHDYLSVLEGVGRHLTDHYHRQVAAAVASVPVPPPRMGVCVFSSAGVWVDARSTLSSQPAVCLMSDVTEQPFAPLPLSDWTFELGFEEDFQAWSSFLHTQLAQDVVRWKEELRRQGTNAHGLDCWELSCGGAALAFLSDALRASGGRGTVVTWRRPNFGVGRLSHRDERRSTTMGGHEDLAPYTPVQLLSKFKVPADGDSAQFYRDLGSECAKNRISLDVVMHCDSTMGQAFLDLATLGELCRVTCGKLLWIQLMDWKATLQAELRRQVQSHTGWDAIFKLRCSAGVQVKSFLSNLGTTQENLVGSPELELSSVSTSTTVAVELEHRIGGIPKGSSFMHKFVYLQSALLYTNFLGQRRMRVSTLALPVSTVVKDVYKSIDFSATAALLMRKSAFRLHQIPSEDNATPPRSNARAAIYHECLHILSTYRKVATGSLQQLLLPDTLRLLPLFCMGLMKSPMLRPSIPTRLQHISAVVLRPCSDERAYFIFYASQASPSSALLLAYPRVFPLTGFQGGAGEWVESSGPELPGFVKLPNALFPTMETLEDDGVYLIDGGLRLYLWIGRDVPPHVRTAAHAQAMSEWNPAGDRVVWQLRAFNTPHRGGHEASASRPVYPPLLLAHEGQESSSETSVLDLMVDDAICGEKDYADFLMRMHQAIRALHKT